MKNEQLKQFTKYLLDARFPKGIVDEFIAVLQRSSTTEIQGLYDLWQEFPGSLPIFFKNYGRKRSAFDRGDMLELQHIIEDEAVELDKLSQM